MPVPLDQLASGGRLVIPVGAGEMQQLMLIVREHGFARRDRYVMLLCRCSTGRWPESLYVSGEFWGSTGHKAYHPGSARYVCMFYTLCLSNRLYSL